MGENKGDVFLLPALEWVQTRATPSAGVEMGVNKGRKGLPWCRKQRTGMVKNEHPGLILAEMRVGIVGFARTSPWMLILAETRVGGGQFLQK